MIIVREIKIPSETKVQCKLKKKKFQLMLSAREIKNKIQADVGTGLDHKSARNIL
jgi:hypothetical protein